VSCPDCLTSPEESPGAGAPLWFDRSITWMHTVTVTRRGAQRLQHGHLWVYAADVADRGEAEPGETVLVRDPGGRSLGVAHYSSTSAITLRLLSPREERIDRDFYRRRLEAALNYRLRYVSSTEAYRLCHAEGDLLPALVIDRYTDYLVVQTLSQGMERVQEDIIAVLEELVAPKGIVLRNDVPRRQREELPLEVRVARGTVPDEVPFRMNGLLFHADLVSGQKTGVFLDQRENYLAVRRYARGRALDCFTSTGGFSLHIALQCESVEAVDTSERALEIARRNAEANALAGRISFREADVFDLLTGYAVSGRRFDLVILDPPAFAKSRAAVQKAREAYRTINFRALQLLGPGGVLVTCSCSHHFTEQLLLETVLACARELGKTLRLLERRYQSCDHPVLPAVPETLYLKCLIFEVL